MHDTVDQVQVLHQETVLLLLVVVLVVGGGWGWQSKVEPIELIVGMMQVAVLKLLLLIATFHDRLVHCLIAAVGTLQLLLLWRWCRIRSNRCVLILERRKKRGNILVN